MVIAGEKLLHLSALAPGERVRLRSGDVVVVNPTRGCTLWLRFQDRLPAIS